MGILDIFKSSGQKKDYTTDDLILLEEISEHLKTIEPKNVQWSVQINGRGPHYKSFFAGPSKKRKDGLLIDVLMPDAGNSLLRDKKNLNVYYRYEGAEYSFTARYLGDEKGEFDSLVISRPERIKKKQKRKAYRVDTTVSMPIRVQLDNDTEEVADLSVGGFSFYTNLNLDRYRTSSDPLRFTLKIPSQNKVMEMAGVVRIFNFIPSKRKSKCAIEFIKPKEKDIQTISKYIMGRQREILNR